MAGVVEFASVDCCSALRRRKRAVLEVELDSCASGFSGVGLALRLGLSLASVPAVLFLVSPDSFCVQTRILSSLSASEAVVFVDDEVLARVSAQEQWTFARHSAASCAWDVVLVSLEGGAVGEAQLSSALEGWEALLASSLRCDGRPVRAKERGRVVGGGADQRIVLTCGGGREGQQVGFVTAQTEIRIQRKLTPSSLGETPALVRCPQLDDVQGHVLLQAGPKEAVAAIEAAAKQANLVVYHASGLDLLLNRRHCELLSSHLNVVWGLDVVCCADDDPESSAPLLRRAVAWLSCGKRVVAVVANPTRLAPSIRALFHVIARPTRSHDAQAAIDALEASRKMFLCGAAQVVGAEEAIATLESVLLSGGGGSVILSGQSGTGKTLLSDVCAASMPHVRGTLARLVHCYMGESERALAALFNEARQGKLLVILDDVDALLKGPTGRGLQLQLARELSRKECRALLTCRFPDDTLSALATRVVALKMPDAKSRAHLFASLAGLQDEQLLNVVVEKSNQLSHAECVQVVKLARLEWLLNNDEELLLKHFESAFNSIGPFS